MVQSCAMWDSGFVGRPRWQRHRSPKVVNLGPAASPSLDVSADISHPSSHLGGTRRWDVPPRPPPIQVQQLNSACCSCACLLHGIQGNVCDGNPGFCMSLFRRPLKSRLGPPLTSVLSSATIPTSQKDGTVRTYCIGMCDTCDVAMQP